VLTVERLDDGEVLPYLVDELRPGVQLELRCAGPFVWEASLGGPLLLLAGGSGAVPLRAILRHHRVVESTVSARLSHWARALDDVIYRDELMANLFGDSVAIRFTSRGSSRRDGGGGSADSGSVVMVFVELAVSRASTCAD
jgi:ferredoxin-NADP reductase